MENTATNVMKSVSLKDAFKAGIVTGVSPVRENENEYLFVTFTDRSSRSTNIYFGKKSALTVEVDDILTPEQMIGAEIILASYEDDRNDRLKLSLAGASEYTDLASIFADVVVEKGADHSAEVLKALKAVMTTREEDEAEVEEEDEDADAVAKAKAIRDAKAKAKVDAKKK